ncbi:SbcC/MukB-like Walker B domain-containing protein [Marinisporobacter balticus]|uniref:Nuclease SbcCD subunit C n=1 Tax=Marinisporobacter balticus TaxID=2018667 RepID=A0A4R2KN95_9FIRM|nr:SbcC/MukB-like Walker B domain-containing protein [Marinisporobacter balticus]TCO74934.1 exonuclease SbcC [Marinisporobacter balticus]
MKPITLKISGLNSFMKEQKIDFKTLTDKGLFGIFGPTGSGKSTILDAVTIALFGEIVRKNRDFMNTNCDNLFVGYEFEIGLGAYRKCYIAERNFRRDKNNNIKTKYARLMLKKSNEELCILAEKPTEVKNQVEKIVGLTLDDFTRSVVLPQGKFSEFLKLKGREKRDMLERIFALEKYGKKLGERIKGARNTELKKQSELNGELKRFENLSEEGYKEKKQELEILKNEEKDIIEKKKKAENDYEKYKDVWKFQNELKDYHDKLSHLNHKKEHIEHIKARSLRGEKANTIKPYIDECIHTQNEMKINDAALNQYNQQLETIKKNIIITEESHRKAQEKKELEIPMLISKENELNRAIEIEKDIKNLEEQRDALLKKYTALNNNKKDLDEKRDENKKNKEILDKELTEKEERGNAIKIDIEYREKIEKALEVARDYTKQQKEQKDLSKKLEDKKTSCKNNEGAHGKIVTRQIEKEKELHTFIQKQKNIEESFPGDHDILLKSQFDLNQLEKKLNENMENVKKRDALRFQYKDANQNKITFEENLKKITEAIKDKENRKKSLELEIDKIQTENIASLLATNLKKGDACPVCGSIHHEKLAVGIENNVLQKIKEEKEALDSEIKNIDKNLREIESRFVYYNNEEIRLKDEIQPIDEKLENIDLETFHKDYESRKIAFEVLKKEIDKWNDEKKNIDEQLNKLKDEKNEIDKKEASIKEGLNHDKVSIEELKKEFSQKYQEFKDLTNTYETLKKELAIGNFHDEMQRIKDHEKEMEQLQKEQKTLRDKIEKINKQKDAFTKEIAGLSADIKSVKDVGQEKREHIDHKKREVKKLTNGENPSEYIIEVRNNIKKINECAKTLSEQLENEKIQKEKIEKEVISKQQNKENLKKIFSERNEKLEQFLKEYDFESKEQVVQAFITKEKIENCNKEVKEHEEQLRNTLNNIERIKKQLDNETIDGDMWNKILGDKKKYEECLKENHTQIGALDITLKHMKNDLEGLKELNKRAKEIEHKLSLLNDMDKLIQGNKFVEFVAMNQLKYIAREASRRLLSITGNRYALEIDDEGNFTVRDDKNGGVVRETASLSGGETFLTSLALALSLSTQIQLKGSAPLEFFFLDEGFGTLDANLLEVVMTSLEKLHTDKLSVGIISHVEELKNRVPVKIIVTPAEHSVDGSKVRLEYS